MNATQLEKCKKDLVSAGRMQETETLIDAIQSSYFDALFFGMGQWKQGFGYYTDEQLIIIVGLGFTVVSAKYANIQKIRKCTQFFLPMGIEITYLDEKTNKSKVMKYSTTKREKFIELLTSKSGVTCS